MEILERYEQIAGNLWSIAADMDSADYIFDCLEKWYEHIGEHKTRNCVRLFQLVLNEIRNAIKEAVHDLDEFTSKQIFMDLEAERIADSINAKCETGITELFKKFLVENGVELPDEVDDFNTKIISIFMADMECNSNINDTNQ